MAYVNADNAAAERLVDGWFLPGDLGWFDPDGDLVIAGRDDDVINAGGNKYSLELIEAEVEEKQDCRCVVLRGGQTDRGESIVLIVNAPHPLQAQDILRFAALRFRRLEIGAIYATEEIKTTEGGKKDRVEMARLFQASLHLFTPLWPRGQSGGSNR